MARRHQDWLAQARRDLKAAEDSLAAGNYEWSAFQAQQAAEKSLKALLLFHHLEVRGHTLIHLLGRVEELVPVPPEYWPLARELDRHYIQPRYPNSFAEGYPAQFYDEETARRCVEHGEQLCHFVESQIS